ncbi:MAG: hypothetical protein Q9203_004699 [Teloschistes exilis]
MGKKRKASRPASEQLSAFAARHKSFPLPLGDVSNQIEKVSTDVKIEEDQEPPAKRLKEAKVAAVLESNEPQWKVLKKRKPKKPKKEPLNPVPTTQQLIPTRKAGGRADQARYAAQVEALRITGENLDGADHNKTSILSTESYDQVSSLPPTSEPCALEPKLEDVRSEHKIREDQQLMSDILPEFGNIVRQDVTHSSTPVRRQLSTFSPTKDNIGQTDTECTINLQGKSLTLVGHYDIWVRKGAIGILGAVLYPSSFVYRVYAPSSHALPIIRPIHDPFGPSSQRVEVTISNVSSGIRLLKEVSPRFVRLWNRSKEKSNNKLDYPGRTFQFLRFSSEDGYNRPLYALEPPCDWHPLILRLLSEEQAGRPKAVLVCGPKGSGKSTFARMLSNAVVTKPSKKPQFGKTGNNREGLILLDVDPGQPEFSPPGEISLVKVNACNLGPPFSHPTALVGGIKILRSHHIGAVSPRDDPTYYLRSVLDLSEHYLKNYPLHPLVVNTAGWIQGSGLDLLIDFIHYLSLTDVIYTSTLGPPEVVHSISQVTMASKVSLHFLTSQPVETALRSAADLRMMQTLSYFHLDEPEGQYPHWNATAITDMRPLSVHYAGPQQAIYGVQILGQEVDPDFLLDVLEGSIVGLVVIEDDAALPYSLETQKPNCESTGGAHEFEGDVTLAPRLATENNAVSPMSIDTRVDMVCTPGPYLGASVFRQYRDNEIPEAPTTPEGPVTPRAVRCEQPTSNTHPIQQPADPKEYNLNPPLPRTAEQIPYIPVIHGITPPLSPTHSCSIGQALIQSVDIEHSILNLISPISRSTLNSLHQQQRKVVMVCGQLDKPTWVYKEDLHKEMHRRKQLVKEGLWEGEVGAWGKEDTRRWAEGRPWIRSEGRSKGERVRRVRRDLGRREKM